MKFKKVKYNYKITGLHRTGKIISSINLNTVARLPEKGYVRLKLKK